MSEQKYYVKLKFSTTYLHVSPSFVVWFKTKKSCGTNCKTKFTKSELAEIMDGALYKHKFRTETQDELFKNGWCIRKDEVDGCIHWEWVNPLIVLVPSEEED